MCYIIGAELKTGPAACITMHVVPSNEVLEEHCGGEKY